MNGIVKFYFVAATDGFSSFLQVRYLPSLMVMLKCDVAVTGLSATEHSARLRTFKRYPLAICSSLA